MSISLTALHNVVPERPSIEGAEPKASTAAEQKPALVSKPTIPALGSLGNRGPRPGGPALVAGNPFADASRWLRANLPQTPQDVLRAAFPVPAAMADYFQGLAKDPAGTLSLTWGGVVGGTQTILDMVVGLARVGQTSVAGLLEVVNGLGIGAQALVGVRDPKMISSWAHAHSSEVQGSVTKLAAYLLDHGSELPGHVGQALNREIGDIQALYAKGDANSKMEAGARFGHLISGMFAAVEGGVGLAKGGVKLADALATGFKNSVSATKTLSAMIGTFRRLPSAPELLPEALGMVKQLAANPRAYAEMPLELKIALREGLSAHASRPDVREALNALNKLDGLSAGKGAARGPSQAKSAGGVGATAASTSTPVPSSIEQVIGSVNFGSRPPAETQLLRQALRQQLGGMTPQRAYQFVKNLQSSPQALRDLAQRAQQIRDGAPPSSDALSRQQQTPVPKTVAEVVRSLDVRGASPREAGAFKQVLKEWLGRNGYSPRQAQQYVKDLHSSPKALAHLKELTALKLSGKPRRGDPTAGVAAKPAASGQAAQLPDIAFGNQWRITPPQSGAHNTAPTAADDYLAQVNRGLNSTDLQQALRRSNSPPEIRRSNEAIKDMRTGGKITASYLRPEVGSSGDRPVDPPRLLTPLERSSGQLSQTFRQNINPALRRIAQGLRDNSVQMDRYNPSVPRSVIESRINEALSRSGLNPNASTAPARHVMTIAEGLDVDPAQLTTQLIRDTREATAQIDRFNPQNPLLVDGSKPATLSAGTRYFGNLFSQGVVVPAQVVEMTVDGRTYNISKNAGLHTTAMNSDIDGPFAASYGQQGLDVTTKDLFGKPVRFHVKLPAEISGTPIGITAPPGFPTPVARITVEIQTSNQRAVRSFNVPISEQQQRLIRGTDSATATLRYVESLSARLFPPSSVDFWQQVSQRNGIGGEYPGNVKSPSIVFNTFGSMGQRAYDNSAELVTSLARSLQPGTVPALVPEGLFAAPNVRVYSGGSAVTTGGVSRPFGLSASQEQSMREVADTLPELVTRYSRKYGISKEGADAWQSSIFANPDIPSIIIPNRTITEFSTRTSASHPGRTFADLQTEIERDLTSLVTQKGMSGFVQLHHTPSLPGDQVAVMTPPAADGTQADFTTEWQFAMHGQKAVPVLDSVSNDLKTHFNIDLKGELERAGYSYGAIRELNLQQTVDFLGGFARSRIEAHGNGRDITPRVIVPVDTYYEKNGVLGGSDGSLIKSAAGLYTPRRTHVVQVDTGGGKPMQGREPVFKFGTDSQGNLTLERAAVDGNGPNGALAPTVYVRSAEDMGEMFSRAYRNQSPLSADEVAQVRRRR